MSKVRVETYPTQSPLRTSVGSDQTKRASLDTTSNDLRKTPPLPHLRLTYECTKTHLNCIQRNLIRHTFLTSDIVHKRTVCPPCLFCHLPFPSEVFSKGEFYVTTLFGRTSSVKKKTFMLPYRNQTKPLGPYFKNSLYDFLLFGPLEGNGRGMKRNW